jgi:hypothetical protein
LPRGGPFLRTVSGIHPSIKLVAVKSDGRPRTGSPETPSLDGSPDRSAVYVAIASCPKKVCGASKVGPLVARGTCAKRLRAILAVRRGLIQAGS